MVLPQWRKVKYVVVYSKTYDTINQGFKAPIIFSKLRLEMPNNSIQQNGFNT
jgi:hypothetical protein